MTHSFFVALAYGATALTVLALIGWIVLDQRARRAEMAALEARGIGRRSEKREKRADDGY